MDFTQYVQSCPVFGARLYLPLVHCLQLRAAAAFEPLVQTGSSSGAECISFLASKPCQNKKKPNASTLSPLLQQLKSKTYPGTSSQPLMNEMLPNMPWKPCRQARPSPPPGRESSDLLLSSREARDLKYDKRKFRDLLFLREFAMPVRQDFSGCFAHLFGGYTPSKR